MSGSPMSQAKFFHRVKDAAGNGSWDGKGMGTLMIRIRNDGSNKPFATFTTEAGRVLYIANIRKDMDVKIPEGGRCNIQFSAPWSPDGTSTPTMQVVSFTLAKGRRVWNFSVPFCNLPLAPLLARTL